VKLSKNKNDKNDIDCVQDDIPFGNLYGLENGEMMQRELGRSYLNVGFYHQ
jgi:hypothetical protein